jgi:hypothetical protein
LAESPQIIDFDAFSGWILLVWRSERLNLLFQRTVFSLQQPTRALGGL